VTPRWDAIRLHYAHFNPAILAARADEWAIDPYEWDGLMHLTPIEQWLWSDIRAAGAVFYPQYPVGRFFVDFANPKAKVAIECDGAAFHQDKAKDAARDAELEAAGWTVYRLSGKDCRTEFDEATMKSGAARKFIDCICAAHNVSLYPWRRTA
jgi:very-short-patch-repair endonuclease